MKKEDDFKDEELEETYCLIASLKDVVNAEKEAVASIEDEKKRKEEIERLNNTLVLQLEKWRVEVLVHRKNEKLNTAMRKVFIELENVYKPLEIK